MSLGKQRDVMAVIVSIAENAVASCGNCGDPQLDGRPQAKQRQESVSLRELHLIQRLRQLGPGSHAVFVIKTTTGRDGLHSFRFVENYGDDEAMK